MNPELAKWLSALLTGLVSAIVVYLVGYVGANPVPLDPNDSFLSFIIVSLVARLMSWLVAKFGPAPAHPIA